jgi:hypothetical protein
LVEVDAFNRLWIKKLTCPPQDVAVPAGQCVKGLRATGAVRGLHVVTPKMTDNVFDGPQVVLQQALLVSGRVVNVEWACQVEVSDQGGDYDEPVDAVIAVVALLPV